MEFFGIKRFFPDPKEVLTPKVQTAEYFLPLLYK